MYGFLNNNYKLRRLDSDADIAYIYDTIREALSSPPVKTSVTTAESNKLMTKYQNHLKERDLSANAPAVLDKSAIVKPSTDDERIVLYYILHKNVRKVSKTTIFNWLNKCEIRDVNIDNAFDLLASLGNGTVNNDTLEFDIDIFRKYSTNISQMLPSLKECVNQHIKLAADRFKKIWSDTTLNPEIKLFACIYRR